MGNCDCDFDPVPFTSSHKVRWKISYRIAATQFKSNLLEGFGHFICALWIKCFPAGDSGELIQNDSTVQSVTALSREIAHPDADGVDGHVGFLKPPAHIVKAAP